MEKLIFITFLFTTIAITGCHTKVTSEPSSPPKEQDSTQINVDSPPASETSLIGQRCDIMNDKEQCNGDQETVKCIFDSDTGKATWQKATSCSSLGATGICIENSCQLTCDPATFTATKKCDASGSWSRLFTTACVQHGAHYIIDTSFTICSSCGPDDSCVITPEDRGTNANPGDSCNNLLFEPRCDNNNAINCVQTNSSQETIAGYKVVSLKCDEQCTINSLQDDFYTNSHLTTPRSYRNSRKSGSSIMAGYVNNVYSQYAFCTRPCNDIDSNSDKYTYIGLTADNDSGTSKYISIASRCHDRSYEYHVYAVYQYSEEYSECETIANTCENDDCAPSCAEACVDDDLSYDNECYNSCLSECQNEIFHDCNSSYIAYICANDQNLIDY